MIAEDGGPAFPSGAPYQRSDGMVMRDEGMSLRDYIAAAALTGILANDYVTSMVGRRSRAAVFAYMHADAMLAERVKEPAP